MASVGGNRAHGGAPTEFSGSALRVLVACAIGLSLGFSVVGAATFGMFIPMLEQRFGWARGDISVAHTVMSYTMAIASPLVGVAFDRFGVRRVLLPSIVGLGLIMASLTQISNNILVFYAIYALVALAGAGTAPVGYMRTLTLWFDRNRGLAFGIALTGVGVGTAVLPLLVQWAIGRWDWQAGYLAIAALILFVSFPVAFLFVRDPGGREETTRTPADAQAPIGLTLSQAFSSRIFWQMAVAFPLLGLFTTGLMAHLIPLLRDRGVSAEAAAAGLSTLGLALIFGRLLTGWLLDRVFAPALVAICIAVAMGGVAMLMAGVGRAMAFLAIVLIGFAIGAELDFMSYLVARYLGTVAYARIYGLMYGIFIAGSGLGPLLMGYSFQANGNYHFALGIILALLAITLPLFLTLGRYPQLAGSHPKSTSVS